MTGAEAESVAHDLLSLAASSPCQPAQPTPVPLEQSVAVPTVQVNMGDDHPIDETEISQAPHEQPASPPREHSADAADLTYWDVATAPAPAPEEVQTTLQKPLLNLPLTAEEANA
jgi:hypothetical protein